MIRRILTPLDPSSYSRTAMEYACYIAKRHQAEVQGLVVLDIPGIDKSLGSAPIGGSYYGERLDQFKKKKAEVLIQLRLEQFKAKCEEEKVRHREAERQGSPSEMILRDAMFYDLVAMGMRTFFHFETQDAPGVSLEKLLDHSITPILAVPKEFRPIRKVLIAFDGSPAAARSLQRFAHLALTEDFEYTLLMSCNDEEIANYYLGAAEAYLKAYGIQKINREWTKRDVRKVVEERFLDWADLAVVGAHSKKGLLDFMTGSLVKFLIQEDKKPIFLSQ